ncbi:MAG TPA: tripartite tricarboxylate transporter substrate binding protein [Burkholderiales bacterium]|nr:tripartite tricarboxylate transporter substrate binding protein [Burkholderiales bacterium]
MRVVAFLALLVSLTANAQFPTKPVHIIVPYTPGGGTDIISRALAARMQESWGQQVLVENRPGANGVIGTDVMVKSPPDGHTVAMVVAAHVVNAVLQPNMPFDPINDTTAVSLVATSPWVVGIWPGVPAQNLREFIAYAKANPGKLRFGSSESSSRLAGEQFKLVAGVDLVHVPYKGGGQIVQDMLGGHVESGFTSVLTFLPHYKSGKLRILAVGGKTRANAMPDVPTAAEAGLPGYETYVWYGMYAPKGTPPAITSRIQGEIARLVRLPEFAERFAALGADAVASTPAEFAAFTRAEHEKFARLVKSANIQPE